MTFLVQSALLVFIACICDCSQAIICFSRGGDSSINNGTVVSCTDAGYNYCYAYSVNRQNFAGCSSSDICSAGTFTDCKMCNTSYCNSMTPSRISCYSRSGSPGSNGAMTTCHTGVSTCYTLGTSYRNTAGCGKCSDTDSACITCNTNYCNSYTPSSRRCFYSPSSGSNGVTMTCATGYSTCYSYQNIPSLSESYSGGCGSCNLTANPTCVTCSTDLCNRRFPSAIGCYLRYEHVTPDGSIANGMPVSCSTGITTCYSLTAFPFSTYLPYSFAGCGTCDPDTVPSCTTCSTGFCNTATPTSGSCYHRRSLTDSKRSVSCYGGTSSCFSLKKEIGSLSDRIDIGVSGCGVCTARTAGLFGCTCGTTNCYVGDFTTTLASRTDPRTAQPATTLASRTDPRTAQPATTLASRTDPRTTHTPAALSSTFSTMQQTTTNPGIRCYYSVAEKEQSARKRVLCSLSNSCYEYNFGYAGATFFFAGCGDCPFDLKASNQQVVVEDSNCRTCKTDYCNSTGSPVQSGLAMLLLGTCIALLQMLHP